MNNGKEHGSNNHPLDDITLWALMRSEPARTLEIMRRHLGPRRAISHEMEHLCWGLLLEHCNLADLAGTVLQRLTVDGGAKLLDLEEIDRRNLLVRFVRGARERLESRAFSADIPFLGETAFESRGDRIAAAALYALAHDDRVALQDGLSRLERVKLRCKLAQVLYAESRGRQGEPSPYRDLAVSALAELEEMGRRGEVTEEKLQGLVLQVRSWLGEP